MSHVIWVLISYFKFPLTIFISAIIKNSLIKTIEATVGAILSTFIITYFGIRIKKYLLIKFEGRYRRFTRFNRFLVKLKRRYGIWGISILTPIFLGPIGVLVSLRLSTNKREILQPMISTIIVFSLLEFLIGLLINIYLK